MLNLRHNINDVVNQFKTIQQSVAKAELSANKKIARQVVTEIVKSAREKYSIKASSLKSATEIKHGTGNSVTSRIIISNKRMPLLQFNPRKNQAGVSVMVLKGNRKVVNSSFIALMSSGHSNIFIRKMNGGRRVPRLPIRQLYGPSAARMLLSEQNLVIVHEKILGKFDKIYAHELEYYFNKNT